MTAKPDVLQVTETSPTARTTTVLRDRRGGSPTRCDVDVLLRPDGSTGVWMYTSADQTGLDAQSVGPVGDGGRGNLDDPDLADIVHRIVAGLRPDFARLHKAQRELGEARERLRKVSAS